ncbi:HD domain-containing protein [Alkalicella caledoniensis]|uniref:HD domain-containing protein n=1 Tax=Alkalicella caledoniensis TaxID=2731377 RepID=A0A7G9W6T0_ALKCA|nr:HD domain-containing protein [Alkalicella caledoniensis]QNO14392.1 HD domain-containing protein [Alkalicella caledoniensis]
MTQRITQFIKSITARITKEDYELMNKYLGDQKRLKELFLLLPVFEQRHCIDVAQTIQKQFSEQLNEEQKHTIMQAALLHDLGKLNMGLNPVTKSVAVIFDKINRQSAMRLTGKMKFMNGYYNHPEIGAEILKQCNVQEEIIYLVRHHHQDQGSNYNNLLNILMEADELN